MRRRDFFWYRKIGEKERSVIGFVRAIGEVGIFWVWVFMTFVRSKKRRNGKVFGAWFYHFIHREILVLGVSYNLVLVV